MTIPLHEYYRQNQFNPCSVDVGSDEAFRKHFAKRLNLYRDKLFLPPLLWKDKRVLEVGCGSGENTLLLAGWGARLSLVEPLLPSVERLQELFRHFHLESAVEDIQTTPLDRAALQGPYDIIVAEGFLFSLPDRKEAIRRLFSQLTPYGLLIVNAPQPTGMLIEYFKGWIANAWCRRIGIEDLEKKVEAIKPFFEEDFLRVPSSRTFAAWVKDNFFNPVFAQRSFCYGFDEMVADMEGLFPYYYSSWPSYKHANDLTWFKAVPDYSEHIRQALNAYRLRQVSFVLGRRLSEKDAMQELLDPQQDDVLRQVERVLECLVPAIRNDELLPALLAQLKKLEPLTQGPLQNLTQEMQRVLADCSPETYARSTTLRSHWGAPCHYIVFGKGDG